MAKRSSNVRCICGELASLPRPGGYVSSNWSSLPPVSALVFSTAIRVPVTGSVRTCPGCAIACPPACGFASRPSGRRCVVALMVAAHPYIALAVVLHGTYFVSRVASAADTQHATHHPCNRFQRGRLNQLGDPGPDRGAADRLAGGGGADSLGPGGAAAGCAGDAEASMRR